ncbi:MAG: hypothetical protein JO020_08790 [Chloroflexi bacterium]|nr:hypothetical protein [Chloroflexota bacterium]
MERAISPPVLPRVALPSFIVRRLPSRDQVLHWEGVWAVLIAYVIFAKILSDTIVPVTFRSAGQQSLFSWSGVWTYALLGLVGIWCARALAFAAAWDARVSTIRRLLVPAAIGLGIGVLEVGIDLLTAGSQALTRVTGQPSFNIDFPGSLLAYSAGAIEVETLYRLFTWPFLAWMISSVVLRARGRRATLWVLGAMVACFEPVTQGVFLFLSGGGALTPLMLAGYLVTALPENILAVIFFRRYGLVAPIALRISEYLVWHILYGNFLYSAAFPG